MKLQIKQPHHKYLSKISFFLVGILLLILLSGCSQIKTTDIENAQEYRADQHYKINARHDQLSKLKNIKMDGHINVIHPQQKGNLFAKFEYNTIDSLKIQLKDIIGRKIALLRMNDDKFHLWLQRKNERLEGQELPADYSYLTLNNQLTIGELRRILLGIPINDSLQNKDDNPSQNIITYQSNNKLNAKYKIDKHQNYIKKITFSHEQEIVGKILYKKYQYNGNVLLPSRIVIENVQNPIKIEIKLSNFTFETLVSLY